SPAARGAAKGAAGGAIPAARVPGDVTPARPTVSRGPGGCPPSPKRAGRLALSQAALSQAASSQAGLSQRGLSQQEPRRLAGGGPKARRTAGAPQRSLAAGQRS